ncbi:MAG: hypothetical protein ACK4RF_08630 [Cyclobacteriaceae bacterium]
MKNTNIIVISLATMLIVTIPFLTSSKVKADDDRSKEGIYSTDPEDAGGAARIVRSLKSKNCGSALRV